MIKTRVSIGCGMKKGRVMADFAVERRASALSSVRCLGAIALLFTGSPAAASNFLVDIRSGGVTLVDLGRVQRLASSITAWVTFLHRPGWSGREQSRTNPPEAMTMEFVMEVDCAGQRTRSLQVTYYDGEGAQLGREGETPWGYVVPGSTGDFVVGNLCSEDTPAADVLLSGDREEVLARVRQMLAED